MGPRPHQWLCECKTAWLAAEILISMGPRPHLRFSRQNSDFWVRTKGLYGSQTTPMVFCFQNSDFRTRITNLYGSLTSPMVFCIQNRDFSIRIANHVVLLRQNDRWSLGPIETCNSDPKVAVLPVKTSDAGRDPLRLAILVLKALFWMQKTIGEVWDP